MVRACYTQKISSSSIFALLLLSLGVPGLSDETKKGQITIERKKKKREIFEEGGHRVDVPPDVSEEDKKALEQTGDDATAGW